MSQLVKGQLKEAQVENLAADPANLPYGRIWLDTVLNKIRVSLGGTAKSLVSEDGTATLTNKTIVAANNTVTTAASGNLAATELNAALAELQTDIDTRATSAALTAHEADTSTHGVGEIVGRTEVQTLTNKTLTSPAINSPTGIVKADIGLGNVDNTSDATKNSAVATLTNKTIVAADNTITTAASGNLTATELNAALAQLQANIALNYSTGDIKTTYKVTADTGWIMHNDGTIGNASSGGTARANADTSALFSLFWDNYSDTNCPVSGGRGASAAADFAANKTIRLPQSLGRVLGIAGAGSGLTSRTRGSVVGAETHQLTSAEMPSHTHVQNSHNHTQDAHTHTQNSHSHSTGTISPTSGNNYGSGLGILAQSGGSGGATASTTATNQNTTATNQAATATNQNTGGDGSHNNMQPTTFINIMIKL